MRKESDHEVLRERKSEDTEEKSRLRRELMRRTGRPWLDNDLPLPELFRDFMERYYTGEDESPRSFLKRIIDESKKQKAGKKHYRESDEEQMDPYRNWSPHRYNSWPFGEQSKEIWPDCIVACVGSTRLFTALEKVKYYSDNYK